MSNVLVRYVPRMLTDDQKKIQLNISRYLLSRYVDDPRDFIKGIVIQDETWVLHFDPVAKMQRKQWMPPGLPPPTKVKRVHSAEKVLISIFWDSQGVIMIYYLEQSRTINDAYYAGKLRWLRNETSRNR